MERLLRTTPRELQGQLITLGLALWTVAIVNSATPTLYLRSGQIRGTDFVQFYALGRLAAVGQLDRFDDFDAIRRAQLAAVPEASNVYFPPVYGPQVSLALAPLGRLSYGWALGLWVTLSAVMYFLLCRSVIKKSSRVSKHTATAFIAAAAFPPFWQLLQHGQLTIVALTAIIGSWLLLKRGLNVGAGAMLGVLAYKPPLLLPVLAVMCIARAWRLLVPAIVAGMAEVLITAYWIGFDGIRRYVRLLLRLPGMSATLFTNPAQAHGLKAFWAVLVPIPEVAIGLYAVSAATAVVIAAAVWRRETDVSLRMAALTLAITLAAPYLFVYDLTILAPAWVWLVDWYLSRELPAGVGRVLYAGYLAPLVAPIVPLICIQPSVVCFAFLLVALLKYHDAPARALPHAAR